MSDYWQTHIATLSERVVSECGFTMHLCAEIEAYVDGLDALDNADVFWQSIIDQCAADNIGLESIAKEQNRASDSTQAQYEFRFKATDPLSAAHDVHALKMVAASKAKEFSVGLTFDPWRDDAPSNGLHWHLHLLNNEDNYCFFKQEEEMSAPLQYVLAGLLTTMKDTQLCFGQSAAAYRRLYDAQDHVPQTVSWGGNNRTVALRLPESVVPHRHIEHRVCASDANIYASVWALVLGVYIGMSEKLELPSPQNFADAADKTYALPRLATHRDDAQKAFEQSVCIAGFVEIKEAITELA